MVLISHLPPELLFFILEFACEDTKNFTYSPLGVELSLVCKYFCNIIRRNGLDLRYVAMEGMETLEQFLGLLKRRSRHAKRVHSLFLSVDSAVGLKPTTESCQHMADLMAHILREINPAHLSVLYIHLPYPCHIIVTPPIPLPCVFPALTDLVLSGAFIVNPPDKPSYAPRLERIQMWRVVVLPSEQTPEELTRLAPNLTRLEICIQPNPSTAMMLCLPVTKYILAHCSKDSETTDHPFPPRLKQLVFDFYPCYALPKDTRERHEQGILTFKILVLPDDDAPLMDALTIFPFPLDDIPPIDDYEEREAARYEKLWEGWLKCTKGEDVSWS
ncbi:hypothetical protein EIP91_004072 [Steccherinum ochraceum]|uniref:F-box domain-containing protein n=1 Tax=Steccherinum ochraceum TaxID=92696 RepID=A0A4R0RL04_9APHY|nr:hypothetical protein EIP91_004072 [Steccherinum ochraceum]